MCQGSNQLVTTPQSMYLYGRIRTPLLCFPAVSTLHLFNSSLSAGRHLALASGVKRSAFLKDDTFEKKIFFWRRLSQHWKEPEDLTPLTFHLAGIKQEPALLLFMTSSVGSVSLTFLLHIHFIAPTVVEVTS